MEENDPPFHLLFSVNDIGFSSRKGNKLSVISLYWNVGIDMTLEGRGVQTFNSWTQW
jgi:hypothetical protein